MQSIHLTTGLKPFPADAIYLDASISDTRISTAHCLPLYEKIMSRLNRWSSSQLSMAGRLVIVKSIGFSMMTYFSRLFILPKKLITMLNMTFNHFLWHVNPFSKKLIPIAYPKLLLPLKQGGLGIINLELWNQTAASHYVNLILNKSDSLWAQWNIHYNLKNNNYWNMVESPDCI